MIVLTGASGGIGQQLVRHLSGTDEILGIYHSTSTHLWQSDRVYYTKLNLEDAEAIDRFAENFKEISNITLVHCAGAYDSSLAVNLDAADWDYILNINLRSNFILNKALLPLMIRDNWGRIIHISSHASKNGIPGTVAYSASKAGLAGMSAVLANEYRRFNITSNVLLLGVYETGMFNDLTRKQQEQLRHFMGTDVHGDTENIATVIKSLIERGETNGQIINVDDDFKPVNGCKYYE